MRDDDNGKIICKWEDHWERHLYMGISWERGVLVQRVRGSPRCSIYPSGSPSDPRAPAIALLGGLPLQSSALVLPHRGRASEHYILFIHFKVGLGWHWGLPTISWSLLRWSGLVHYMFVGAFVFLLVLNLIPQYYSFQQKISTEVEGDCAAPLGPIHRVGLVRLSELGLRKTYRTLLWHHSRDPALLRVIKAEMTALPWYCPCGRKNRKNAWNCPDCRTSWTYGTPAYEQQAQASPRRSQQAQTQAYSQAWQWPQEPWVRSQSTGHGRSQSPRQRQDGQTGRRKSRRGRKAKKQGQVQYPAQAGLAQPPLPPPPGPPPATPSLAAPLLPMPATTVANAPVAPALPALSEDSIKLRALTQKLKKHQDRGMEIPVDVQEDLKEVCVTEAKANRKTLHLAVNAMDDARQVYDDAVAARASLHSQWKNFLAESLKMWQGHTANFQAQETLLTERIQQAKDAFVQARDTMNAAKIDAAKMVPVDSKDEAQSISDDEECKDLKDVPMAAAERIATGLNSLVETMTTLHSQTEELVMEEQRSKRPRVAQTPTAEVAKGAAPGAGIALSSDAPPFGVPGGP